MKAYALTSGSIFGLIVVAHVARVFAEGSRLATEPSFVVLTLAAGGLCAWGFRVASMKP